MDPTLIGGRRGLGMSDRQMLPGSQLPLAAPVIIGGIRTATVLVVGTATLATPVGVSTLGNYIFCGLETRNHVFTVFGCVVAALLAVTIDQLIRLLELAVPGGAAGPWPWSAASACCWWCSAGCTPRCTASSSAQKPGGRRPRPLHRAIHPRRGADREAEDGRLHRGAPKRMGEGIQFQSICSGEIDCYVDYSGNIWALDDEARIGRPRHGARAASRRSSASRGVVCLGPLGFENAYALAMTRKRAAELNIQSLDDLRRHAGSLKVGGDNQIFLRQEWRDLCADIT